MSLRILRIATNGSNEDQLGAIAEKVLRPALSACGAAVLLVPSFQAALDAQRALAAMGGLSLGVTVTTPSAWARERWEVWGDGRRIADGASRQVVCARVLGDAAAAGGPEATPGCARLLSDLVRQATPWMRGATCEGPAPDGVTAAEQAVVSLVGACARELARHGMVEECEATVELAPRLAAAGVRVPPVALLGFSELPRAQRELVRALAASGEVTLAVPADGGPAAAPARALADALAQGLDDVAWEDVPAPGAPSAREPELDALLASLYRPSREHPVRATGALSVALPSGPAAEPELVASQIEALAAEGMRSVVVASPDAREAWRTLSGRLAARGVSVRCQLSVPVASLPAGAAFLAYLRGVSRLAELTRDWPASQVVRGSDVRVALADMSWWPPRDLSDFLMSDISHVPAARARALDRDWRANRLLTPAAVLTQLQGERDTSAPCAAATRELLRGRVGSAASKLLAPYVNASQGAEPAADAQARAEAVAVLTTVLGVAKSLKEVGLTADPEAEGRVSLAELVSRACDVLEHASVQLRLSHEAPDARCRVLVTLPSVASGLEPASADALVCMGQTSAESGVSSAETPLASLLFAYGVEPLPDPMARARTSFAALAAVPRRRLVLERCLFGADSKERYPSVTMSEALACYGLDATCGVSDLACALGEKCVATRPETLVSANASATGEAPRPAGSETPAPAGSIAESRRAGVMAPPEGVSVEGARPLLSASQIETYLECPYKWFSLRRLRLRDADAGFTGAEMGTFAHRVLEVTHRELLARAVERANGTDELGRIAAEDPEGTQSEAYRAEMDRLAALAAEDPTTRLAGSRVDAADAIGTEAARRALLDEFDAHLAHQHQLVRGRRPLPQALVPHTAAERGQVEGLRRDLLSLLDYEGELLAGYEPRLFEWGFGRGGNEVEYAGVRLTGTVDRVDVDAHGQAVVIDYKHKSDRGFAAEYDVFPGDGAAGMASLTLPRRVQSLVYGQVIRRAFPDLKVTGAVYLCTKGAHELSGAVSEDAVDNVFGTRPVSARRLPRLAVPRTQSFGRQDASGMDALLDACEEAIAHEVSRMMAGYVEANPKDPEACRFCPVLNCERRLRK